MGRLEGKVAIITGAGRGIGRAAALRFAAEGASLVVADLDSEPLKETAAAVGQIRGGSAVLVHADLSSAAGAQHVVDEALEFFSGIDILVNNAGTTRDRMFHTMSAEDWDLVLEANLGTAVACTRAVVVHMRETAKNEMASGDGSPAHHRKITFTTSIAAMRPEAGQSNYVVAKSAILGFTKALSRELGPFHINVNAVAPGFIDTRLTAERVEDEPIGLSPAVRESVLAQIALGRFGSPEDVANAHVFLASAEADYISGAVLPVAGGLLGA